MENEMRKIEQHMLLKDGRKLGFAEYGSVDGFPIIYCHGSQSSRLEMHYDLAFTVKHKLRILTIDRPGHGISDFNATGSIHSFAKDVKQLTERLGIVRFSVVGMSAGAPFALGIAHGFPEYICKTAIVSGFAPFNKESKKYLSREVRMLLNVAKTFPFLLKLLLKLQARQLAKNPKKALRGFLKMMSEPDQRLLQKDAVMQVIETMFKEAFRNGSRGIAYEISNLLVQDWAFELAGIEVPVTFWHGEKDTNVPLAWAEWMANQIEHANLKTFPEEGHLLLFEHADALFSDLKPTAACD